MIAFQLARPLAGRLILLTLLALVAGWGLWGGAATPQVKCPVGQAFSIRTKQCENPPRQPINARSAVSDAPAPMTASAGAAQPRVNLRLPPSNLPATETNAAAPALLDPLSGPCPNSTSYAWDPRKNRCVVLRQCPTGGLIWNPDKGKCVPRPLGGTLECLDGYLFNDLLDTCVPPNCGTMVFSLQQGQCVPPAPISCPPGQLYNAQTNQCVAEIYDLLEFVVGTGSDNLEGYSVAVGALARSEWRYTVLYFARRRRRMGQ